MQPIGPGRGGVIVSTAVPQRYLDVPLVGRESELQDLRARAGEGGLVTVLGPAGMGKTRLVRALAEGRTDVLWLDLCEAMEPDGALLSRLVAALGVGGRSKPPAVSVAEALDRRGYRVVVLDTVEHVEIRAVLAVVRRLVPQIAWVCTSRRVLDAPGEAVVDVGPLDPESAARLFEQRLPGLARGRVSSAEIEGVVALLEGVPLALELAAARLDVLTVPDLHARLSDRLSLLRHPGRSDRHASLEATLGWSWELLGPDQRLALTQLTVFVGGAPLAAAEHVVRVPSGVSLDAIQGLLRHSLVQIRDTEAGRRLVLLDLVRDFATARAGDVSDARGRHAAWFARALEEWSVPECASRRTLEESNLLLAQAWMRRHGEREQALGMLLAMHDDLLARWDLAAYADLLAEALEGEGPVSEAEVQVRSLRIQVLNRLGRTGAAREEVRRMRQGAAEGTPRLACLAEGTATTTLHHAGEWAEAAESAARVHHLARELGWEDVALHAVAYGAELSVDLGGDVGEAVRALSGVLGRGEPWARLATASRLGRLALEVGDTQLAEQAVGEERAAARASGLPSDHTAAREAVLSVLAGAVADPVPVRDRLRRVREHGDLNGHVHELLVHGLLTLARDPEAADSLAEGAATDLESAWTLQCRALCHLGLAVQAVVLEHPWRPEWRRGLELASRVPLLQRHGAARTLEALGRWMERPESPLEDESQGYLALLVHAARALTPARLVARQRFEIQRDGQWFCAPCGKRTDLSRRVAPSRVLARLLVDPDVPVSSEALIQAGWPGEVIAEGAAKNRLYVAIHTLRKAGLPVISEGGYRLDVAVRVVG